MTKFCSCTADNRTVKTVIND